MWNILQNKNRRFRGYNWCVRSWRIFLSDDNEEIDDDLEILHNTNIFEDEVPSVDISQPLTQECILRQVGDVFAVIKSKCEEEYQ